MWALGMPLGYVIVLSTLQSMHGCMKFAMACNPIQKISPTVPIDRMSQKEPKMEKVSPKELS